MRRLTRSDRNDGGARGRLGDLRIGHCRAISAGRVREQHHQLVVRDSQRLGHVHNLAKISAQRRPYLPTPLGLNLLHLGNAAAARPLPEQERRVSRVHVGRADRRLTPAAGLSVVDEVDRIVGLSGLLEEGIGQVKQRDRGVTGAQTLVATRASGSEPPPDPGRFSPGLGAPL